MMAEAAPMGEVYLTPATDTDPSFFELAFILRVVEDPRSSAKALARAVETVAPLAQRVRVVALAACGRVPADTTHAIALLGFTRVARLTRDYARQVVGGPSRSQHRVVRRGHEAPRWARPATRTAANSAARSRPQLLALNGWAASRRQKDVTG